MRLFRAALAATLVLLLGAAAHAADGKDGGKDVKRSEAKIQAKLAAADSLYNEQRWDDAITAYRAILAETPALTVALLRIADACRYNGDYDHAVLAYAQVLKTSTGNDEAMLGLAFANLGKGDLSAAEQTLKQIAAGRHATREVFYNLGELARIKNRSDEAAAWYGKALALDPTFAMAVGKLAAVKAAPPANAVVVAAGPGGRNP